MHACFRAYRQTHSIQWHWGLHYCLRMLVFFHLVVSETRKKQRDDMSNERYCNNTQSQIRKRKRPTEVEHTRANFVFLSVSLSLSHTHTHAYSFEHNVETQAHTSFITLGTVSDLCAATYATCLCAYTCAYLYECNEWPPAIQDDHIYTHMHLTYVCIWIHVYIHPCIRLWSSVRTHTKHIHTNVHTHTRAHTHYIHALSHRLTHTYTHTHIHITWRAANESWPRLSQISLCSANLMLWSSRSGSTPSLNVTTCSIRTRGRGRRVRWQRKCLRDSREKFWERKWVSLKKYTQCWVEKANRRKNGKEGVAGRGGDTWWRKETGGGRRERQGERARERTRAKVSKRAREGEKASEIKT